MQTSHLQHRAAVVGLGSMGYGMALSLRRRGLQVAGFDVRPEVAERFAREAGGSAAATARDAAKDADIVVIVVVNADQTETILF
ncbi:NAD(P)-binding domain-containing protein, partial [Klebsiella pneumoniae]|uniref:NAD(P)-binding domain-containing protein n=1 Tax=Klebsiella pneumoniae TaxID=573 RepID=UPI0037114AE8